MVKVVHRPEAGCMVEFMQGNQPQLAVVLEEQSGKLRLLTHSHREATLTANRLLPWSGPQLAPPASRAEAESAVAEHQARRVALAGQVDAAQLWDMAQGEVAEARAEWFAELLFSNPDHDQIAAVGRALLGLKTHFKLQPPAFQVYTAQAVEARRAEEDAARRREELLRAGQPFLKDLWQGRTPAPPAQEVAERLSALLLERVRRPGEPEAPDSPEAGLWKELTRGLPEHPHLAQLLAERWGLLPAHYNYHLDRADYAWGDAWAEPFAAEAAALAHAAAQAAVQAEVEANADSRPFVSIDAETTQDIDDAFHISDDGARLAVAIACPLLDLDSPLGRAVAHRASSLYLPEGVSHMLPRALAEEAFSLKANGPRTALVLDFDLAGDEPALISITFAAVRLTGNISYARAETLLAAGETPLWRHAAPLGERLRQRRIRKGAVCIDRLEPELSLCGQGCDTSVRLEMKEPTPLAQLLVSELMILANEAVARYGQERGLPLLHRAQEANVPPEAAGVWTAPEDVQRAVKLLGPSCLGLEALPHRGLGLSAYAPSTSPIRRLSDLVNVLQLTAHVRTGQSRWGRAALAAMLPAICARLEAVGQVQRFRPRYWKLLHLQQNRTARAFTGVAVDEAGAFATLALPELQLYVRVPRKMLGDNLHAGQRFGVMFGRVDPLCNEMRVAEAWEEPPEDFGDAAN